jgi:hypothetical protein
VLQVNQESIWAGPPVPQPRKQVQHHLEEARRLCFEGTG